MQEQAILAKISSCFVTNNVLELQQMEHDLVMSRMDQDKQFTDFLKGQHHYAMSPEDTDTELWRTYKKMLSVYDSTLRLIKTCTHYRKMLNVH